MADARRIERLQPLTAFTIFKIANRANGRIRVCRMPFPLLAEEEPPSRSGTCSYESQFLVWEPTHSTLARRTGIEPVVSCVTGKRLKPLD